MAIKVDKKDRESFESMLKRFNRIITRNRVLTTAREKRYHEKKPNKMAIRRSTIRKEKIRVERKKAYFKQH